jgi:hypothetical protein
MMLLAAIGSGKFDPGMLFMLVFAAIGLALVVGGINQMVGSTVIDIDLNSVSVTRKTMFGTRQWSEPLSRFEGALSRSEYHSGGKNRPSYTLYIVELKHVDPKKSLRLYESKSDMCFRTVWEDYCRQLNVPALEMDGTRVVKREAADLDKSVRELVREGKMKVDFDPSRPPPRELALRADGDVLELTVVRKKTASIVGMVVLLAVPATFMCVGFLVPAVPVGFGIVGAVLFAIFLLVSVSSLLSREQIRIGKESVETRQVTRWGVRGGDSVESSRIETGRIGTQDGRGQNAVLLETDEGTVGIGSGLSQESLEWLKNCIARVISA